MAPALSVALVGGRDTTRTVLQFLLDSPWEVSAVVAPTPANASERVGYVDMGDLCKRNGIELVRTSDINEASTRARLAGTDPDVGLCCGWTQIVSEAVLDVPELGFYGVHASQLPKGRGGAPVNWQIIRGRDAVGVSLFEFVPEVDHGEVLGQMTVPVEDRDDVATVYEKVTTATLDLLERGLRDLATGDADATPQSFDDATYNPQRKPSDGLVDWTRSPTEQWNWIRAQTAPYPGAFTFYDGQRFTLWSASVPETEHRGGSPGEVLEVVDDAGVDVRTGDGTVRLERVQLEDRPAAWADEFAERTELTVGDVLGEPAAFPDWLYTGIRGPDGGLQYETNVPAGETVTTHAVCCSHACPRSVEIIATLDGQAIFEAALEVDGWMSRAIEAPIPSPGSHSLAIEFYEGGDRIDTRRLVLYGAAPSDSA